MRIIRSRIPEKYLCSMLLYVRTGSLMDGEEKGIAHVTEHMLVAFDKRRTADSRSIYEITAHTSYEYMTFIIQYDRRMISQNEVEEILYNIASGRTLNWKLLEECKEDVRKEIDACRQEQVTVLRQLGETEWICHLPLGEAEPVQGLGKERIEWYIKDVFLKAEKQYISITPASGNQYHIRILPEGQHPFHAEAEPAASILDYIFKDILYILCEKENQLNGTAMVHMYSIRSKSYIIFTKEEFKRTNQELIFDKKRFLKSLFYIRNQYMGVRKFNMNNMNQIVVSAIHNHTPVYQMRDVRKMLYWIPGARLYEWYTAYVRELPVIVRNDFLK